MATETIAMTIPLTVLDTMRGHGSSHDLPRPSRHNHLSTVSGHHPEGNGGDDWSGWMVDGNAGDDLFDDQTDDDNPPICLKSTFPSNPAQTARQHNAHVTVFLR